MRADRDVTLACVFGMRFLRLQLEATEGLHEQDIVEYGGEDNNWPWAQ